MPSQVPKVRRRTVFGRDPAAYARARLGYPDRVYELLASRCGLRPGAAVVEIGPGTGIASRELLRRGADPLTLVEADPRLARYLRASLRPGGARLRLVAKPFERAPVPRESCDLVVAASSFHWMPPRLALRKVARALRPGGWWAAWNNHHGDPYRASPFFRRLQPLYRELRGGRGSSGRARASRARDAREGARRIAAVRAVGSFDRVTRTNIHWDVTLPTPRVVALWGTFSDILTLPERDRRWFLHELGRLVEETFGGSVTIPILTPVYTAQRR